MAKIRPKKKNSLKERHWGRQGETVLQMMASQGKGLRKQDWLLKKFWVYFERSHPSPAHPNRRTLRHYARGAPPILYVPMEIFLFYETGEKGRNQKWVVYIMGGSSTPKIWEHPWAPALGCRSFRSMQGECNCTGTSPTTKWVKFCGTGLGL